MAARPPSRRAPPCLAAGAALLAAAASAATTASSGAASAAEVPRAAVAAHAQPVAASSSGAQPVVLPRDAAPHHGVIEWWYFNGHLHGTDAAGKVHDYGFEYVTFQFVVLPALPAVYVGQLSVADLTRKTFQYDGSQASYPIPATPGRFSLHTGSWSMSGAGLTADAAASMPGYALKLHFVSTEKPVLEGPRGIADLGPFGKVDYYSETALQASGTMLDHGSLVKVSGIAWMDHEWGANVFGGAGWDWFSVQLSNGRQYMLQFARDKAGTLVGGTGTHVGPAGVTYLPSASIAEHATGSWTSPATHITYGLGWQLKVPHGHLTVTPDLVNQEVDEQKMHSNVYWEGDCTVTGVVDGKPVHGLAYTEINPPGQNVA